MKMLATALSLAAALVVVVGVSVAAPGSTLC